MLLSTYFQNKETNGFSITNRSRHDQITWITANAVEEDVRRPYRRKRSTNSNKQGNDRNCTNSIDKKFMSFAGKFTSRWNKRKKSIEDLRKHYVRTC